MRCARFCPKKTVPAKTCSITLRRKLQQQTAVASSHDKAASAGPDDKSKESSNTRVGTRQSHPVPRLPHLRSGTCPTNTAMGRSTNHPSTTGSVNVAGPKCAPSDAKASSSGRHPQPPSANNAKLKHKCPFDGCPWRFATPYKLRRHIKSHTKETPYLCKECGRGFSVRYNLLMHIQTIHSQPHKYKCPLRGCKDAFHSQPRLNGHLRRVHKKDWKTLQIKPEPDTGSTGSSRSSSISSTDSTDCTQFECIECRKECGSRAKLTQHMRTHATLRNFKCTVQDCDKTFTSKDRLSKHLDTHKHSKQFCCPHENCNRIFLRQSHLKNHLKIHTQGHFLCPVLDCSHKFASESEYNEHLNTHINYSHRCPVPACQQSFSTSKRLELHCHAMHGTSVDNLAGGVLGHASSQPSSQGLLPPSHPHTPTASPPAAAHVLPPSLTSPPPIILATTTHDLLHYVDKDIIENVELPGLAVEDIDAVLAENSDWSGEQVEQFLRSAVDLSEIESRLFSVNGYESDSGYSTYDVSPVTSGSPLALSRGAPPTLQVAGPFNSRSLSPALTPVDPSPLISLSPSSAFPLPPPQHHHHLPPTPLPLSHGHNEPVFFHGTPPPTYQASLAHDGLFPTAPNHYPMFHPFAHHHDYAACPGATDPSFSELPSSSTSGSFSSEFTEFLASAGSLDSHAHSTTARHSFLDTMEPMPSGLGQRRSSDGQLSDMFFADGTPRFEDLSLLESRSLPNLGQLVKHSYSVPPADVKLFQFPPSSSDVMMTSSLGASPSVLLANGPKIEGKRANGRCAHSRDLLIASGEEVTRLTSSVKDERQPGTTSETDQVAPKSEPGSQTPSCSAAILSPETMPLVSSEPAPVRTAPIVPALATISPIAISSPRLATNSPIVTSPGIPPLTPDTPLPTNISSLLSVPGNSLQSLVSLCSQMPVLNKLVATSNNPAVFLIAISTALSTLAQPLQGNGVKSHEPINLAQLQTLVARIGASQLEKLISAKQEAINAMSSASGNSSPGGVHLLKPSERRVIASPLPPGIECPPLSSNPGLPNAHPRLPVSAPNQSPGGVAVAKPKGPKGRLHRAGRAVPMKSAAKKKSKWPRSMNKANLLAFREHILNKLKKNPDGGDATSPEGSPVKQIATMPDACSTVTQDMELGSHGNCSEVFPVDEFEVTYERNRTEARCSSEPARLNSLSSSPLSLHGSHSAINILGGESNALETMRLPLLSDILLQGGDCDDFLSFQFNPDSLLSSSSIFSAESNFAGMLSSDDEHDDDRLAQGGTEDRSENSEELGDLSETGDSVCGFADLLPDSVCLVPPTESVSSPSSSSPTSPSSFQNSLPQSSRASPSSTPGAAGVAVVASSPHPLQVCPPSVVSGVSQQDGRRTIGNVVHSFNCGMDELGTIGLDGECTMRFQIQTNLDSILQTHHDPLLAGSTCRNDLFDF